jgi:hypothetical protein
MATGATVPLQRGGTGQATAAGARKVLGLEIGVDIQPYDLDLVAYAALTTTGFVVRTGDGTAATREILGTVNQIDVANGTGVAGNITLSIPDPFIIGDIGAEVAELTELLVTGDTIFGGTVTFNDIAMFDEAVGIDNNLTLIGTEDSGALLLDPNLFIYRNSPTPAITDVLGAIHFEGNDSLLARKSYGQIYAGIDDLTLGNERGSMYFNVMVSGTPSPVLQLGGTQSAFLGDLFTPNLTNTFNVQSLRLRLTSTTDASLVSSDHAFQVGASNALNVIIDDNEIIARSNGAAAALTLNSGSGAVVIGTDLSVGDGITFGVAGCATSTGFFSTSAATTNYFEGALRMNQNTTSAPGTGNNTVGACLTTAGQGIFSSTGTAVYSNRTVDGTVAIFSSAGTTEGSISIAAATTAYNAFFGSHWAQLADNSRPDILPGTICESIDQMSIWPHEGVQSNERLPCFKISDKAGSKSVYGVFFAWDIDDEWIGDGEDPRVLMNDAMIGSLGAFVIRIHKDQNPERGDYIESNGDGTGRVQKSDNLKSSTVAKITSTQVQYVYDDGSYLLPCTLHCG